MEKSRFKIIKKKGKPIRVDLQALGRTAQLIYDKTGIRKGGWVSMKKIEEICSKLKLKDVTLRKRVYSLVSNNILKKRRMTKEEMQRIYGSLKGKRFVFTIGSTGKEYIRKWKSFINQNSPMMELKPKIRIIKELVEKKVEVEKLLKFKEINKPYGRV